MSTEPKFETWAIVEIMGHHRYGGLCSEQTIAGAAMLRVDVPDTDPQHPAFTKFFGAGAIYGITPVSEEVARRFATGVRQRPVEIYELPKLTADHTNDDELGL